MIQRKKKIKTAIPISPLRKYLASLVQAEERLDFKAGQTIFYEGHFPYGVYVLSRGRVRLFRKKPNGAEELQKIIEPTQILGEEAFVENKPFEYSARAETDVSISFFSRTIIKATSNTRLKP